VTNTKIESNRTGIRSTDGWVTVSDSDVMVNLGIGVYSAGGGSNVTLRNTNVVRNTTGIYAVSGGDIVSCGGNSVIANNTNGTFTTGVLCH
jgi:hypothetical protein